MNGSSFQLQARHGGFTLIELMLALAMTATVAITLAINLNAAFHETRAAEGKMEPVRTAALSMEFIREDLQNILPPNPNALNSTNGLPGSVSLGNAMGSNANTPNYLAGAFEGQQNTDPRGNESDIVEFYTTSEAPEHIAANGEIKQVTLQVVQDAQSGDYCLVRRVVRNLLTEDQQVNPDEEIICRGVKSFTLEYFDGTNWDTAWDSTQEDNTTPAAVQVTMQLDRPIANTNNTQTLTYQTVFQIPTSVAAFDTNVNGGGGL